MNRKFFVAFTQANGRHNCSIEIEAAFLAKRDLERLLMRASRVYAKHINSLISAIEAITEIRLRRKVIPLKRVWKIGDIIFNLVKELGDLDLELDDLYYHLVRDLNVKRKWLEKVIILRRYIDNDNVMPDSLSWGQFEKGTKRKAQQIKKGLLIK